MRAPAGFYSPTILSSGLIEKEVNALEKECSLQLNPCMRLFQGDVKEARSCFVALKQDKVPSVFEVTSVTSTRVSFKWSLPLRTRH